jgi:hypothetical protein
LTVNTVTISSDIGGDNNTYSDGVYASSSPVRGMDGGGHRLWFIPLITVLVGVANWVKGKAVEIQGYAASAVNAPGTSATSTSTIAIPASVPTDISLALLQAGKAFTKGQTVCVAYDTDPTVQMVGPILAFDATAKTMTVRVLLKSGSGSQALWNISVAAPIDASLTGRMVALETELARLKSRSRFYNRELR